jgi:hypothetical protein
MAISFRDGHKLDEKNMDKLEAIHFIAFLEEEKYRHVLAMRQADANRYASANIPVLMESYKSSVIRHIEDIVGTQQSIDYLMKKFNLTTKDITGC